ncbi:MAG: histidine phosphatase family protein [Gammaproteobacteria bacterium]|nr:MAG: histidine phosphatase family protein [Gammaproteobacteria bacterium]
MHDDATRFWVVRHGQIAANVTAHWHGSTDSPLTETGRRQVERVAAWFEASRPPLRAVYSSPLARTRDTATGIATRLGLDVQPLPGLREYCLGEWEGTHYQALNEKHGMLERMRDPHWAPPGGESIHGVLERMLESFHQVANDHRGEEVLMVGHGAATGIMLAHLLQQDALGWHTYHLKNCSVSEFWLHPEPGLGLFNHVDHLED